MLRRPRDAVEAKDFIMRAHFEMKGRIDEGKFPNYTKFWHGINVLLETGIFQKMDMIVAHNVFSQVLVNRGTPIFEGIIRDPACFEEIVANSLKHKKKQKRTNDYRKFVEDVVLKSSKCLTRKEVQSDLKEMAKECNDAFTDARVIECVQMLYISMKSFRKIIKLLNKRMEPTFMIHTTFASNAAMKPEEAQEVMHMIIPK